MQTAIKPFILTNASLHDGKLNYHTFAAWLFTTLVVLVCFKYGREGISALLMKLHELFIQKNALNL